VIAVAHPSRVERLGERERDGGGRRVAGALEHGGGPFARDAESLARSVDDAHVGLVGHQQRDLLGIDPGPFERSGCRVDRGTHRAPEHLAAFHLHVAADLGEQQLARRSIRSRVPREQLARPVHRFDHHRARAVGEQNGGVAIFPVGEPAHRLCTDQQHALGSHGQQTVRVDEPVHEAGARRIDVARTSGYAEPVLHFRRGGR
jgi:hypothetical protein